MANVSRILALALFALAALFGLYAVTLTRATSASASERAAAPVAPAVAVIVAARDLAPGRALSADDLAVGMQTAMPAGGFDSATTLIGRVPVARIAQGGALTEGALANGLAASIQTGERAVAVRVDESNAVSNLVKPGDTVDVFIVMKRDAADGEIPATHARLLLSRVRVLSFGDSTTSADAGATRAAARTAVLAVRVDDVDSLSLAENSGRLLLALRNPADADTRGEVAGVSAGTQSPVARAVAGLSLGALAGGALDADARASISTSTSARNSTSTDTPMLPPLPATLSAANRAVTVARAAARTRTLVATNGVEVIRGATRESIPNN